MIVFVLGTGRCGSTLVQEVLARHPDMAFVSNIEDRLGRPGLPARLNGATWRRLPPSAAEKGRLRFAPSEAYRVLDRRVSPILSTPERDLLASDVTPWLAQRLRAFFEESAQAQGRPVFLHKFTGWPRARFLAEVFPEARFINVVRDGRAVANSWLQMDWWPGYRGPENWSFGPVPDRYAEEYAASGRSFVSLAGIGWKILLDAFEETRAALPADRWLEVRYEDVVADPRARLDEMLRFSGLTGPRGSRPASPATPSPPRAAPRSSRTSPRRRSPSSTGAWRATSRGTATRSRRPDAAARAELAPSTPVEGGRARWREVSTEDAPTSAAQRTAGPGCRPGWDRRSGTRAARPSAVMPA